MFSGYIKYTFALDRESSQTSYRDNEALNLNGSIFIATNVSLK